MRKKLYLLFCLFLFAPLVNAQEQSNVVERIIVSLRQELLKAAKSADTVTVDRIVADDYIETESSGEVGTKSDLLKVVKFIASLPRAALPPIVPLVLEDVKVRGYGDTAVLTAGNADVRKGETVHFRFTEVYVKRNGKWQIVAAQSTIVAPNKQDLVIPQK